MLSRFCPQLFLVKVSNYFIIQLPTASYYVNSIIAIMIVINE